MATKVGEAATALQRKIFSRWVAQKLQQRNILVDDVVNRLDDGLVLVALLEVLSEKQCTAKLAAVPKGRLQQVENCNHALNFAWQVGVDMKIKPQGTDLVDKVEKNILGLIWAVMIRFFKLSDDADHTLNAKDALLLWAKQKVAGYAHVNLSGFGKDWHNGMALCAIINKHRPKLLNYSTLSPADGLKNVKAAQEAAFLYFQLDQYITPEEFQKLDDNSMFVYVSEYYYGIAEQRKMDLAARRIGKVIKLTKENDAMKADYLERVKALHEVLERTKKLLEDRTIDNTMAGAKRRIAEFYEYKAKDKNQIIQLQLNLEGIYNNLSMRLAHNKRPEWNPGQGSSLKDIGTAIKHLEECEQERKVALHNELNRQIRLAKLDEQHSSRWEKVMLWIATKETFLKTKQVISSVSGAELQLSLLAAYESENAALVARSVAALKTISAELAQENFEHIDDTQGRDADVEAGLQSLAGLLAARKPVAEDDLEREKFKEEVRLLAQQHEDKFNKLSAWVAEKEAYLIKTESVGSVADARKHLSLLDLHDEEEKKTYAGAVAELKALGATILGKKYKTEHSAWEWEDPSELNDHHTFLDDKFTSLKGLSAQKRQTLDAALALELEKERLRLEWTRLANEFTTWVRDNLENVLPFTQFGYSLEEVEAFAAQLAAADTELKADTDKRRLEFVAVHTRLNELGVTSVVYSKLTLADLDASEESLKKGMDARRASYDSELTRQRANDALCREFAGVADPFAKFIVDRKDQITTSRASLEDQLKFIEQCISTLSADSKPLDQVNVIYQRIEEAGITNNRHTQLTAKDVEAQWQEYSSFCETKKTMLAEEIRLQTLRGITQEQLQEIRDSFATFDSDKSNSIDAKELKACLYSLGEERPTSEVAAIMEKFGTNGSINLPQFEQFMIGIYGDSDNKEEILASFKLINRGDTTAKADRIDLVMTEQDSVYFKSTAPAVAGGWNYTAWTDDVYSR